MIAYLCVALGSALGGVGRYGFGLLASRMWGDSFPWGTIVINIVGSFIIGFFGALTAPDGPLPAQPNLRIFVMVGICGGFTTFSSFSLQTLSLARDGSWLPAMGNVLLSVTLCLLAVTIGHFAASRIGLSQPEASELSRSILAILDHRETAPAVLAAAALLADGLGDARIEALHVRHEGLEGFLPTEDVVTADRREEIDGEAALRSAGLRGIFDAWRWDGGSREWREIAGDTARVVAEQAANADLVVIGIVPEWYDAETKRAVHAALFDARRPTLLTPPAVPASLGRNVAIAWKPGDAANRAIEAALPLLLSAARVSVLIKTSDDGAAPDELPGPLQRAGIAADVVRFQAEGQSTGAALLARAHAAGADLLVMGAFTHGPVAEAVLGGATRDVLAAADMPVLMRH
jgi:CrcB protein